VGGERPAGAAVVRPVAGAACGYAALAAASLVFAWVWGRVGLPTLVPRAFPIHFYQRVVGPVDGRRCSAYPVCSRYGREAIDAHGLLIGSWLALDRLIHESGDLATGPWVVVEGVRRLDDPVLRNDRWLQRR